MVKQSMSMNLLQKPCWFILSQFVYTVYVLSLYSINTVFKDFDMLKYFAGFTLVDIHCPVD